MKALKIVGTVGRFALAGALIIDYIYMVVVTEKGQASTESSTKATEATTKATEATTKATEGQKVNATRLTM